MDDPNDLSDQVLNYNPFSEGFDALIGVLEVVACFIPVPNLIELLECRSYIAEISEARFSGPVPLAFA